MSDQNAVKRGNTVITEGIVLAAISSFIYLVTFCFEAGYCYYFGIPLFLITPNLTTVFVAAAAIAVLLVPAWPFLNFTTPLIRGVINPTEKQKQFRSLYVINVVLIIPFIFAIAAYGLKLKYIGIGALVIAVVNLWFFGPNLWPSKDKKTLAERFQESDNVQAKDSFHFIDLFLERFGRKTTLMFIFASSIVLLAFVLGNGHANRQVTFPVLKNPAGFVLLRSYPDVYITAPIDRKTKRVLNTILILKASEVKTLEFDLEAVGPLDSENYR